jgi:hypothetical protein
MKKYETKQIDVMGMALLTKQATELGWEVFVPAFSSNTRTDLVIASSNCNMLYTIQAKSTQVGKIATKGRQGPKKPGKGRNSPVVYNSDYLVGINVNTGDILWFPREYYQARNGNKINLKTMSENAVKPPHNLLGSESDA